MVTEEQFRRILGDVVTARLPEESETFADTGGDYVAELFASKDKRLAALEKESASELVGGLVPPGGEIVYFISIGNLAYSFIHRILKERSDSREKQAKLAMDFKRKLMTTYVKAGMPADEARVKSNEDAIMFLNAAGSPHAT